MTQSAKDYSSHERAKMIQEAADDMKAVEIEVLDVRRKTSATRFFVICTGTSDTHLKAIAEKSQEILRDKYKIKPLRKSSRDNDGWIIVDFGDVVMHIMSEEKRQFYDLESLWAGIQPDPNLVVDETV